MIYGSADYIPAWCESVTNKFSTDEIFIQTINFIY